MQKQNCVRPIRPVASFIPSVDPRAVLARRLDLIADLELQHGHHGAAERLAHAAAEMRESRS